MKHLFSLLRGWPAALLILLWLAGPVARAQSPAWNQLSSGVHVSSNGFSYVYSSATDAAGNVYLAGYFTGTVSFGTTLLTSNNNSTDGFVAKWNSATGTFGWALALGGASFDRATAVAVSNGSVYVAGNFSGTTATFGPFSLTNTNASGSFNDVFVAKLTDAGPTASFGWVRQAGSTTDDQANSLAVSGSSVYFTGSFSGPTLTAGSTVLTNANAGTTDLYVAKLTDAGATASFAWGLDFGGSGFDDGRALALGSGGLYVVGNFTSPTLSLGATALPNAGGTNNSTDVFMARLADAGTTASVVWAQRAGGPGTETADALTLNGSSLYVAGGFTSATTTVGPFVLTNANSTTNSTDVFVAKFTDTGASATALWAQSGGGIGNDQVQTVAVRGSNVYVAGTYGYPNATFGTTVLSNRGTGTAGDIFVVKLTDSGSAAAFTWAQSAGGLAGEAAFSLVLTGNLVVAAGGAAAGATFGTLAVPPGNTTTSAFVASLPDPTLTATAAAQGTLRFSLYPNPARAATTVLLPAGLGTPTATLTLTDALGRTLRTETVNLPAAGLRHELDLSGLAPGLYAVQVQAGATSGIKRLVVE